MPSSLISASTDLTIFIREAGMLGVLWTAALMCFKLLPDSFKILLLARTTRLNSFTLDSNSNNAILSSAGKEAIFRDLHSKGVGPIRLVITPFSLFVMDT